MSEQQGEPQVQPQGPQTPGVKGTEAAGPGGDQHSVLGHGEREAASVAAPLTEPGGDLVRQAGTISPTGIPQTGMFGISGTGDTSGFGGLVRRVPAAVSTPRPYGGWFDEAYDALERAYPQLGDAVERVVVDRGELTIHIKREAILEVCRTLRDDPALQFQLLSSVSGVDYLDDPTGRRLHVVYHLTSMTKIRRLRLEVSLTVEDPHLPSVVSVFPTANWQERETWDFFGVVFDGHPGLTRIFMPDDWEGHPQRKDYPLGGIPVEYKGAHIPPPDQRRAYA